MCYCTHSSTSTSSQTNAILLPQGLIYNDQLLALTYKLHVIGTKMYMWQLKSQACLVKYFMSVTVIKLHKYCITYLLYMYNVVKLTVS